VRKSELTNELINSDAGLSFFGSSDGNVSNRLSIYE
jgi:hypothetical protein